MRSEPPQDLGFDDMLDAVLAFVPQALPWLIDPTVAARLRFRRRPSGEINASVMPRRDNYLVRINDGFAAGLHGITDEAQDPQSGIVRAHLDALRSSMGSIDAAASLPMLGGLCFVMFHEVAHVLSGHVDYDAHWRGTDAEVGFDEVRRLQDRKSELANAPLSPLVFARSAELEADGHALQMLLALAPEIAGMLLDEGADPLAQDQPDVRRALLLGALAALILLQDEAEGNGGHPPVKTRLINLSTVLLRVLADDAVQERPDGVYKSDQTAAAAESLATEFQNLLFPVLLMLDVACERTGRDHRFLVPAEAGQAGGRSALMDDILLAFGGGMPENTAEGRLLADLVSAGGAYYMALAEWRVNGWGASNVDNG